MSSLSDIPSDVLFVVLTHLESLDQLYNAIRSCKALSHAFNDRRSLILTRVFETQVRACLQVNEIVATLTVCKQNAIPANSPVAVINRCKDHPQDALTLHLCAWKTAMKHDSPTWVPFDLGHSLVIRASEQRQFELALTVAETLWNRMLSAISNIRFFNTSTFRREYKAFAQKLIVMYTDAGRHEDAKRIFRQCYQSQYDLRSNDIFNALLGAYRKSANDQGTDDLVVFFQEQTVSTRQALLTRPTRVRKDDYNYHAEQCLIAILSELNRTLEAATTLQDALSFAEQHNLNLMPLIGTARTLIKNLKNTSHNDGALNVRSHIFDIMSARVGSTITVSAYVAWAKEYASELRAMNKKERALEVDRQVWEVLWQRSRRTRDGSLVYNCRNAAWALHRAYHEAGMSLEARQVISAYEDLAGSFNESSALRMRGPDRPVNADAIMRARTLNLSRRPD